MAQATQELNFHVRKVLDEYADPKKGVLPGLTAIIAPTASYNPERSDIIAVILPRRRWLSRKQRTTMGGVPKFIVGVYPGKDTPGYLPGLEPYFKLIVSGTSAEATAPQVIREIQRRSSQRASNGRK